MANIDWSGHLEAYHTDGRVVPAWLDECVAQPDSEGDYSLKFAGKGPLMSVYRPDGLVWRNDHADDRAWRIRNVAPVAAPNAVDLNERCRAMVKIVASSTNGKIPDYAIAEAKAIIAAMNPVDLDLIEARDCVAKVYEDAGRNDLAIATRDGKQDNRLRVQSALAAFRRGRDFGNGGK